MNENTPQELNPDADAAAMDELTVEEFAEVTEDIDEIQDHTDEASDATEASIIEKLKAALDESEKRALIAAADLENYRKRSAKNTQDQIKYASLPIMGELLEAVDNLNRAIESADEGSNSGLLEGVKMVSGQILNILTANNCKLIPSVGEPFDPNLHQAVQMQPSDDYPENIVMMEMRTGYRLHDRVIRPSQVFVSTGSKKEE